MAYIDLDIIKNQLNIDLDFCDEDEYILSLSDAAISAVERHIDHDIEDYVVDGELEAPLRHACLLLISTWYQNRESVAYGSPMKLPHGVDYLLETYIDYSHCDCR